METLLASVGTALVTLAGVTAWMLRRQKNSNGAKVEQLLIQALATLQDIRELQKDWQREVRPVVQNLAVMAKQISDLGDWIRGHERHHS